MHEMEPTKKKKRNEVDLNLPERKELEDRWEERD